MLPTVKLAFTLELTVSYNLWAEAMKDQGLGSEIVHMRLTQVDDSAICDLCLEFLLAELLDE